MSIDSYAYANSDSGNHENIIPPANFPVDMRDAKGATVISDLNGYYDSQNIVALDGGPSLNHPVYSVILHRSNNREGGPGLCLYQTVSFDLGKTWSQLRAIETNSDRQSHDGYQLVAKQKDGSERLYLFYGYNQGAHHPQELTQRTSTKLNRTDMQAEEGYYLRYSDDLGQTWSDRIVIPVRRTAIDQTNPWQGEVIGMFMCDKPSIIGNSVYFAFQKTKDGAGETPYSEVFFLHSPDLLGVNEPKEASWETLPQGEHGLQVEAGLHLGEEPHILSINERQPEDLLCYWRCELGYVPCATSRDGGRSWSQPKKLMYHPGDSNDPQYIKHPRGSITAIKCRSKSPLKGSQYALLFYNNGHTERYGYVGRKVIWLSMGRGNDRGEIHWHQPEIVLWWDGIYLDDRENWNEDWAIVDGVGYCDFLEHEDGKLLFVGSNKFAVRLHEIDFRLLKCLQHQPELQEDVPSGRVLYIQEKNVAGTQLRSPILPDLRAGGGFSLLFQVSGLKNDIEPGQVLIDAISKVTAALDDSPTDSTISKGYEIVVNEQRDLELHVTTGFGCEFRWQLSGQHLWDGNTHFVAFVIDGGPKVISVVLDDRLWDGGDTLPQGWGYVPKDMGEIGGAVVTLAPSFDGVFKHYMIYDRPLLTSEAISIGRWLRNHSQSDDH